MNATLVTWLDNDTHFLWSVVLGGLLAALVGVAIALLPELLASLRSRGEDPADDWMDIADVVSDDHHPDDCDCTDISFEGVTDKDAGVLRRNWMALTDDERDELNEAFDSIANHYEGV